MEGFFTLPGRTARKGRVLFPARRFRRARGLNPADGRCPQNLNAVLRKMRESPR